MVVAGSKYLLNKNKNKNKTEKLFEDVMWVGCGYIKTMTAAFKC